MQNTDKTEMARQVVNQIHESLNRQDVDAIMALMSDDVVFENTGPAPDGSRHVGQGEMRQFWQKFVADSPNARFETEDQFATDDRCVISWRYIWNPHSSNRDDPGYVRGVSLYRIRDGKVAEMSAYVKG